MKIKKNLKKTAWDAWCIATLVGIWPRFVEPKLLRTTSLSIPVPNLPSDLEQFTIVQLSDLHFSRSYSQRQLNNIMRTVEKLNPDLIVFTGDFINYSKVEDPQKLKQFLCSFEAPYGCYAVVGNHDYETPITINSQGEYDTIIGESKEDSITRGILRILKTPYLAKKSSEHVKSTPINHELSNLLNETPFKLLHNQTAIIPIKKSCLNVCGLGEYMAGQCLPEKAFESYDQRYPGIVLAHNPDSFSLLRDYPGDLILSGHTHGCQINIPWVRNRITLLENPEYNRGLYQVDKRLFYINRGLGASLNFRWFAVPEVTYITLYSA